PASLRKPGADGDPHPRAHAGLDLLLPRQPGNHRGHAVSGWAWQHQPRPGALRPDRQEHPGAALHAARRHGHSARAWSGQHHRDRATASRRMDRPGVVSTSPFDLSGRVALITGASRGIGRAIAEGLAEAGADLVLSSRDATELERVAYRAREL